MVGTKRVSSGQKRKYPCLETPKIKMIMNIYNKMKTKPIASIQKSRGIVQRSHPNPPKHASTTPPPPAHADATWTASVQPGPAPPSASAGVPRPPRSCFPGSSCASDSSTRPCAVAGAGPWISSVQKATCARARAPGPSRLASSVAMPERTGAHRRRSCT